MYNKNIQSASVRNARKGFMRLHIIPLLVWLSALAVVVFLLKTRIQRFEVVGMAHSKIWQVSAVETGKIKSMSVELFDEVKKGQILAVLNSELIDAKLKTIEAEAARLRAELDANRQAMDVEAKNSSIDMASEYRRFSSDVENARLAILELKAVIEPDRILLKDYQAEINIEKELLASGAISTTYNIEKAQAMYDNIALKIEKNTEFLGQAQINLEQAIKRRDKFLSTKPVMPSQAIALAAISKAIDVQQRLMDEIHIQGNSLVIESPADGIVTRINARAGQVAAAEIPILTIAQPNPTEIIGYASDLTHNALILGQKVQLVRNGSTPQIAESQIVQVGPAIDLVPDRLMINPDRPQWGRPFIVKIPPGMKLAPGEKIGIRGLNK